MERKNAARPPRTATKETKINHLPTYKRYRRTARTGLRSYDGGGAGADDGGDGGAAAGPLRAISNSCCCLWIEGSAEREYGHSTQSSDLDEPRAVSVNS